MNTQHTPGEWEIHGENIHGQIMIGPKGQKNSSGKIVKVGWDICGKSKEEWKANARLIAAAPDLLEALQYMVNCNTVDRFKCELPDALNKAKEAIQKALQ